MNREEMLEEISDRLNADETEYCDQTESHFLIAELKKLEAENVGLWTSIEQYKGIARYEEERTNSAEELVVGLRSKLDVAVKALENIAVGDCPENVREVREGYLMNEAREALAQIQGEK